MADNRFDRDEMARWYAAKHIKLDPGNKTIYYLPTGSPEREIRLLEVNDILPWENDPQEPFDLAVDIDGVDGHKLMVLDITPSQWDRILKKELSIPKEWTLDGAIAFHRGSA